MAAAQLNVHSYYSLGYGTASPEELVARAASLGLKSLALTDIESLAGQVRFHAACASFGVRPVTGLELRRGHSRRRVGERDGRLVLLARDQDGYSNLCRIVSKRLAGRGLVDPVDSLEQGAEGLFLLTDDVESLRSLLDRTTVDERFVRLLLSRPVAEEEIRRASAETGVPIVSSPEIGVLDVRDGALHRLVSAIHRGITIAELDEEQAPAQLDSSWSNTGADQENERIAEACSLDLLSQRRVPPRLPGNSAGGAMVEVRERCRKGLESYDASEYEERLELELGVIERLGFADYFLAVAEIAAGARQLRIPTAGRGSAAGSLAAFLLGITDIDPVRGDLLFERFLHEYRDAPPDIDLDVASTGRDALKEWTRRRFGRNRVAGVATYSTFRARSAVRAGLAAVGLPAAKIQPILRSLESAEVAEEGERLVERTLAGSAIPVLRKAGPLIAGLIGLPSHLAAHPGGLVIGDRPLADLVPLDRASGGQVVTQYDYRSAERAGFLKIDLLGNHFLSEMQDVLAARTDLESIPREDPLTWQTIDAADTVGCFQIESPAVRSVLEQLPMREFSDLVAALAIVRPGAASGTAKERYVRRARGEEEFEPLELLGEGPFDQRFDSLRQRLSRTYGVILFDEDIIRLLSTVAGIGLAPADSLRTAIIAAGEDRESLSRLGADFLEAAGRAGTSSGVAERAWTIAIRFASYSFAEAHAASYADLAWKAAYLRTHAPREFGCALINHHRGLYPLRTTAAAVERWGVDVLPPNVNSSRYPSRLESGSVRIGLAAIKGLSRRTAGDILEAGPFAELGELLDRARPAKRELRALLLSGACDDLPPLSAKGYPQVHEVVLRGVEGEASPEALEEVLARVEYLPEKGEEAENLRRYRALVRVRNEIRFLGMHPSGHPLELLRPEAERLGCLRSSELSPQLGQVRFAGLLAAMRRVPTSEGELRYLTFEDESGLVEGLLAPRANERLGRVLTTPGPYLAQGRVHESEGALQLLVTGLKPFHER